MEIEWEMSEHDIAKALRRARRQAQPLRKGQVIQPRRGRKVGYSRKQKHRKDWE